MHRSLGKRSVHFIHIGKTGGTAIKHALKAHLITNSYVIELHPHSVRLRDIPVGDKVIFFVRDPISRFVSGFYSRRRQGLPRHFCVWSPDEALAFKEFDTPNSLAMSISSDNEEKRKIGVKAMNSILHVSSSFWDWFESESYFLSRLSDIFFIGFQESLSEEFELLIAKLDLPQTVNLPNDDVQSHRNPLGLNTALQEEAIANLKEWYARDYDFLNLCKEKAKQVNSCASQCNA